MTTKSNKPRFENLSESALLVHLDQCIDAGVNARVQALCIAIRDAELDGIEDVMPAYASALLRFDANFWARQGDGDPQRALRGAIEPLLKKLPQPDTGAAQGRLHELPVCYGGDCGADLDAVAEHCGLKRDEVIRRHCEAEYHVAMLGFAPGFAYLLGLNPSLQMPRHDKPRTRVPAGSVGIGGAQTGIYPRELPGGWQLLGRTPAQLFDPANSEQPALLEPGDRVRFVAIGEEEFARQSEAGDV